MKSVIEYLESSLDVLVTNESINRAEGKVEQADSEAVNASECRQALAILMAADAGPIWPKPLTCSASCGEPDKCLIMGRCLREDDRKDYFAKYGKWPKI